jgi:hypothetical protein
MNMQRLMLGGLCAVMLTACATSQPVGESGNPEPSGFLKDYSKLRPAADETEPAMVYFTPDKAKFKSYTKILLEPVQIWRSEKPGIKHLNKEDATYLSEYLWARANEELSKDYTMVEQPGPGVARVRVAITEAGKGVPMLDNLTAAHPGSMLVSKGKKKFTGTEAMVGSASVEAEVTDSQTGELLVAGVDRRGGGKYAWKPLNTWEDVEQACAYWAKKARWRACVLRGDSTCELPKE